jgi:hypothetical protein
MTKPRSLIVLLATLVLVWQIGVTAETDKARLIKGQSHASLAISGKSKISWKDALGHKIAAQGIAWGHAEKGLGDRVILDGTTIYVVGPTPFEKYGRLVEVSGRLDLKQFPGAPATAQGFGPEGVEYYQISDAKWQFVEEVSHPQLVVHNDK